MNAKKVHDEQNIVLKIRSYPTRTHLCLTHLTLILALGKMLQNSVT